MINWNSASIGGKMLGKYGTFTRLPIRLSQSPGHQATFGHISRCDSRPEALKSKDIYCCSDILFWYQAW